jgi:ribosomal protein L23
MSKSPYEIVRKPVITEKGLGVKETESTLVFQVAADATKTEIKEAVQKAFKVKVAASARTGRRPMYGLPRAKRCPSTRRTCKG